MLPVLERNEIQNMLLECWKYEQRSMQQTVCQHSASIIHVNSGYSCNSLNPQLLVVTARLPDIMTAAQDYKRKFKKYFSRETPFREWPTFSDFLSKSQFLLLPFVSISSPITGLCDVSRSRQCLQHTHRAEGQGVRPMSRKQ
jgi:hypothetical protein